MGTGGGSATAADVQTIRNKVQELKNEKMKLDQEYGTISKKRMNHETKLANISQTIQMNKKLNNNNDDVTLVEDIVVITMMSETEAQLSLPSIANPATLRTQQSVPGTVSSAEEAVRIYTEQCTMLKDDIQYKIQMIVSEKHMCEIYERSEKQMKHIITEYCLDKTLVEHLLATVF